MNVALSREGCSVKIRALTTTLMTRFAIRAVFSTALTCAVANAFAQQKPEEGQGVKNAVAMCIGCHGIPGYKTAFPDVYHVPKIAGQQPGYIVNALKAYKSGERSHPSMRGIAASLTEKDMTDLANYYGGTGK